VIDALTSLLAVSLLLAALAPVLMAGGACIAAFMMQRDAMKHLLLTVVTLVTLVLCAFATVSLLDASAAFVKAAVLAAPVWAVYLALKHFLFKNAS
jgi:hypothetical protein